MKKKLIFVTEALWIGGIETALVNLLNRMDYNKYDITLLVLRAELDLLERIHPQCRVLIADREHTYTFQQPYRYSRLYHLTEESSAPSTFHKRMMWAVPAIKWVENRLYIRYIRKLMKDERFDTAVIYSDVAAETTVRGVKADKYLMFYHHGAMRHVYHDDIGYQKSDRIIAVSENQASELKRFVPKYAEKIVTIHNLTDVDGIREKGALPTAQPFDKTKFNIVSVGRVSREKGMDLAVRACAKLVADGFDHVRWWIVGDGPAMGEVLDTIAELHMEEHVVLVGMQSNPYPYIRQADLYVQPSRVESFGLTIKEAMILGKPIVSTNNNGAREILDDGMTGILCPIDAGKIANSAETLIVNQQKRIQLRENARKVDFEEQNRQCIQQLEQLL